MKSRKVSCERRDGRVIIKCPVCRTETELVIGEHEYSVDVKGFVHPDFVCMATPGGAYCQFSGPLWIVN